MSQARQSTLDTRSSEPGTGGDSDDQSTSEIKSENEGLHKPSDSDESEPKDEKEAADANRGLAKLEESLCNLKRKMAAAICCAENKYKKFLIQLGDNVDIAEEKTDTDNTLDDCSLQEISDLINILIDDKKIFASHKCSCLRESMNERVGQNNFSIINNKFEFSKDVYNLEKSIASARLKMDLQQAETQNKPTNGSGQPPGNNDNNQKNNNPDNDAITIPQPALSVSTKPAKRGFWKTFGAAISGGFSIVGGAVLITLGVFSLPFIAPLGIGLIVSGCVGVGFGAGMILANFDAFRNDDIREEKEKSKQTSNQGMNTSSINTGLGRNDLDKAYAPPTTQAKNSEQIGYTVPKGKNKQPVPQPLPHDHDKDEVPVFRK